MSGVEHRTDEAAGPARQEEQAWSRRRLGREALIYGLGTALSRAAAFIMLPVYTRILVPADYGLLQMLDMTLEVASILVSAGVTAGVMRFYFKATTERERGEVLGSALVLQVGLNLLGTLILMSAAGPIWRIGLGGNGSRAMVQVAAVNFTLSALSTVPLLQMQMRQKAVFFSAATIGRVVFQLSLNILFLVVLRWGPMGILLSTMATHATIGGIAVAWLFRSTRLALSRAAVGNLRRFGLPYQIATAASFILTFGDRFFLQATHGLAEVGIYGMAYQFGFLLDSLGCAPFFRAWGPQRYQLASQPREYRDSKYNQGFLYLSLILVTLAVGMSVFVRPVFQVMSDASFWSATKIVPVVLAAYVVQSWSGVVQFGVDVSERTRYITYAMWISVVVVLGLYALLIPPFGGMGAATATLAAFLVRFALLYRFSHRLWPVSYQWGPSLKLAAFGTLAVLAAMMATTTGTVWLGALGLALTGLYGLAVWLFVLGADDRALLKQLATSSPLSVISRLAKS